jgi:hypothetical protein
MIQYCLSILCPQLLTRFGDHHGCRLPSVQLLICQSDPTASGCGELLALYNGTTSSSVAGGCKRPEICELGSVLGRLRDSLTNNTLQPALQMKILSMRVSFQ